MFSSSLMSTPEKRLVIAVIQRAIMDRFVPVRSLKNKATQWLIGSDSAEKPYSFAWCLDQLDLLHSIKTIRKAIMSLKSFALKGSPVAYGHFGVANNTKPRRTITKRKRGQRATART